MLKFYLLCLCFSGGGGTPFIVGAGLVKWGSAQASGGLTGVEGPVGPMAAVGPLWRAVGPPEN